MASPAGVSRRILPQLVEALPAIDIFLHDSLHTYGNVTREFSTVWPKLRAGGALVSDDVEINRAFEEFAAKVKPALILSWRGSE